MGHKVDFKGDVAMQQDHITHKSSRDPRSCTIETHVFLAVLFAALLHAGWNSVIKSGLDHFSSVVLMAVVQAAIAIPVLPFVAQPDVAAWGWVVAASALHFGYKLFLVQAYAHADLSQAYPLARGTAPLVVTVFSVLVLGVAFSGTNLIAILMISFGILLMALKGSSQGRMPGKALFYVIGTAGFTASYTLVDGTGARVSGAASGFFLWMALGDAVAMMGYAVWKRGANAFASLIPSWKTGTLAGAMSMGSYWIAIWAFTQAPIALVATLRESSILFAILIAGFVLREEVSKWRWASACAIAGGVVLMRF